MEPINKLLVIVGPTASGKTNLAIHLAKEFNGELISADSRQVYKGMDIGTGKDLPGIRMYDVVDPDQDFSVAQYVRLATKHLAEVHHQGKLPILVGGTGLYIKALIEGIDTIDVPRNEGLRQELAAMTVPELQTRLPSNVLETMNNSDRNNPRRLIRKIEILSTTSRTSHPSISSYDCKIIGLLPDTVEEKIISRVHQRIDQGIIQEIESLLAKGYSWDLPSMKTFGYKEWKTYIENPSEENKQKATQEWIKDEINYSKKQMTWFKKQKSITWYPSTDRDRVIADVLLWYTSQ